MNKKKIIIIASIILGLAIIGTIIFFVVKENKSNTDNKEITITFDADGGKSVKNMKVKIGEKVKLPETTKENYTFEGWYNKEKKYTDDDTTKIKKDITLKAKWKKKDENVQEEKSIKITFDSKGGSNVESITLSCTDNTATVESLPKPEKDAYNFLSWEDKHGKTILEGAKLTCDGDLTLYANWEYDGPTANPNPATDTNPVSEKKYKCPKGYELKDQTKCVKLAEPTKYCENNWKEVNGECVNLNSPNPKGERYCEHSNYGTGVYYEAGRGYCGYMEMPSYTGTQSGCENAKGTYVKSNNRCFKYIDISYKVRCANGEKKFGNQEIAPGNGGGCYQVTQMKKKCPDGYTKDSAYGECAIVKEATYE